MYLHPAELSWIPNTSPHRSHDSSTGRKSNLDHPLQATSDISSHSNHNLDVDGRVILCADLCETPRSRTHRSTAQSISSSRGTSDSHGNHSFSKLTTKVPIKRVKRLSLEGGRSGDSTLAHTTGLCARRPSVDSYPSAKRPRQSHETGSFSSTQSLPTPRAFTRSASFPSNKRQRPSLVCNITHSNLDRAGTATSNLPESKYHNDNNHTIRKAIHQDSGYVTRENTLQNVIPSPVQAARPPQMAFNPYVPPVKDPLDNVKIPEDLAYQNRTQTRQWDMLPQLNSSVITLDQLKIEIQKIFRDLTNCEHQCKQYVEQANNLRCPLSDKQKQTLLAYHRTLLYDHHDFLMATQHPVATPDLRGLAAKENIPARLWKHGVHNFLELLRCRRSEAEDYLIQFLILAYQMMALLYETVPAFLDTWIECLGDLARYSMAVEGDKSLRTIWGVTAAGWYSLAADRHPTIGRLNHHLGILEKPSIHKIFLYSKALICRVRFGNAWDSLATFYAPVSQRKGITTGTSSTEATIVAFHALHFSKRDSVTAEKAAATALSRLGHLKTQKLRDIAAPLTVTNISLLFEHGVSTNQLWQLYNIALMRSGRDARNPHLQKLLATYATSRVTSADHVALDFTYHCSNTIIRLGTDRGALKGALPAVHVMLVFVRSLLLVRQHTRDIGQEQDNDWFGVLLNRELFNWAALCRYLNAFTLTTAVSDKLVRCAKDAQFPVPEQGEFSQPLPDDYHLQGLIFAQQYHPAAFFSVQVDRLERYAMNEEKERAQVKRVLWLGLFLAYHSEYLHFDLDSQCFSTN